MMKTRRTLRRVGLLAGTTLLALAAIAPAASPTLAKPAGSIWTTNETCESLAAQNENHYAVGDVVYLRGSNFAASSPFSWTVTGKPGGASGDPNQDVAVGDSISGADGAFCVAAYTVAVGDWGEYSVMVEQGSTRKNDNFSVEAGSGEEPSEEPSDSPPSDVPTDDPSDNPPSDVPTDDPSDDPSDNPPSDVPTDDPSDDLSDSPSSNDPSGDPTGDPSDDPSDRPVDESTNQDSDPGSTPPEASTQDVLGTTDGPVDESTNQDSDPGSTPSEASTQDVLGTTGGPTLTPPPTDTIAAPSGQNSGNDWRLIVAGLGFLVLAAALALPNRRARA